MRHPHHTAIRNGALPVTHIREESFNETFQARLETFVNALSGETIDEGYRMPSEDMFLQLLQKNKEEVSRWFHTLENDESDSADLISKIIYMTSHISFETISQAGTTTFLIDWAQRGLTHPNLDVQEAAIGAFENWRGSLALYALNEFYSSEQWLQQYVHQIISELEEELFADGVPGSQYHYINRPKVFHNFSNPKDFFLSLPNCWVGRENARG